MNVVIAGSTGFVGKALIQTLHESVQLRGLSRGGKPKWSPEGVDWKECDLFSLTSTQEALEGADVGIYLIHSMLPSSSLDQSSFEDLDFLLADNFARAAKKAGLRQIIYLGGLIPEASKLSSHLKSRLEVEHVLGAHGVPVTALRAGLILGAEGSSFQVIHRLVHHLPVMVCPKWTQSPTQAVALRDVVASISFCINNNSTYNKNYDLGCSDYSSWLDLMNQCASRQGLKRWILKVPIFSPVLSRLWVSLITGAPKALIAPLVRSLGHSMVTRQNHRLDIPDYAFATHVEALRLAMETDLKTLPQPRAYKKYPELKQPKVRSIQRMFLPEGWTSKDVAKDYFHWLDKVFLGIIRVKSEQDTVSFFVNGLNLPLLILKVARQNHTRQVYEIVGGKLLKKNGGGKFEFRLSPIEPYIFIGIHDFTPALPWQVYLYSQAIAHLWVMRFYGRHLKHV